jgi:hypothetical protein
MRVCVFFLSSTQFMLNVRSIVMLICNSYYTGILMVAFSPLSYFLQTIPPTPALPVRDINNDKKHSSHDKEEKTNQSIDLEENTVQDKDELKDRPFEDISAPDIKTALKEAFTNPTFIFITLGFTVCGFHVAFLSTHFPAYLVSGFEFA